MKITNCQVAVLEVFGFTGETFRDAERAFHGSLNDASKSEAEILFRIMDAASEADRAAEQAAESARSLAERLLRDAESFEAGHSDWNALGFSTTRDLADARVQLQERAKAVRTMIALVKGNEASVNFTKICERNVRARLEAKGA